MLPDELLHRIVSGSGRVYSHEAKDMAAEILKYRNAARQAAAPTQHNPGLPYPKGLYP